jgi:hypothetical protein
MSRSLALSSARAAASLAGLLVASAAAALDRGDFHDGLYTAPGELFTVESPLGPSPVVIDSFDRSAGAVTFVDEAGALFGVICTPSYDVLASARNDAETDLAILRNWFRDATFPLFFESQIPGAEVLHEGAGSFEGKPAWLGVIHLPQGSARFTRDPETGLPVRADSCRGIAVFSRGDLTFLIMTEIDPKSNWDAFLPRLSDFYRGMAFTAPVTFPYERQVAAIRP